jgi:hypothetical protein
MRHKTQQLRRKRQIYLNCRRALQNLGSGNVVAVIKRLTLGRTNGSLVDHKTLKKKRK